MYNMVLSDSYRSAKQFIFDHGDKDYLIIKDLLHLSQKEGGGKIFVVEPFSSTPEQREILDHGEANGFEKVVVQEG